MKSLIVIMAALAALAGCSKPQEESLTGGMNAVAPAKEPLAPSDIPGAQDTEVSHAKPKKQTGWDAEMQRSREEAPPLRKWGK